MLPDMDGLEVCRKLRAGGDTPILMLTARGDAMDRVVGLEMGADDYLPKPFEPRELLARLRSILRRTQRRARSSEILRFGRLEIDTDARQVRLDGEPRVLTSYQFALLLALAQRAGRVMSREALMDLVKNERLEAFDRSIDVHISRIRAAIEDDPKKPHRVITVRGAGYVFAKAQTVTATKSDAMRRLYQKIYLVFLASLLTVVVIVGLFWRLGQSDSPYSHGFEIAGELAMAALPPADAPPRPSSRQSSGSRSGCMPISGCSMPIVRRSRRRPAGTAARSNERRLASRQGPAGMELSPAGSDAGSSHAGRRAIPSPMFGRGDASSSSWRSRSRSSPIRWCAG